MSELHSPRCNFTRVAHPYKDVVQCMLKDLHKESHMTLNPGPNRNWDSIDYTPLEKAKDGYL